MTDTPTTPDDLLNYQQAAELLGTAPAFVERLVNRSTVYDLLGRADLPSVKIGRRRLISRQSLVDFISRSETQGPT